MSRSKVLASTLSVCSLLCVADAAVAAPALNTTRDATGDIIVAVSADVPRCGVTSANASPTFSIDGTTVTVTQPLVAIACIAGQSGSATKPYKEQVDLGQLANGTYGVDWSFPKLTGQFTVGDNPGMNISAAMTGAWYDPDQAGQGFDLQVIDGQPQQLLVSWFTFAPGGGATWIVGSGPISGNRADIQAAQTVGPGAQFPPNFDARNVSQQLWGTISFVFDDCNHAQVSWHAADARYPDGTMSLTRLTQAAGLSCP